MAGVAFLCGDRARPSSTQRGGSLEVAQLRATIRLGRAVSVRGEVLSYREKEHGKRAMKVIGSEGEEKVIVSGEKG
jgi:hypothetical protein